MPSRRFSNRIRLLAAMLTAIPLVALLGMALRWLFVHLEAVVPTYAAMGVIVCILAIVGRIVQLKVTTLIGELDWRDSDLRSASHQNAVESGQSGRLEIYRDPATSKGTDLYDVLVDGEIAARIGPGQRVVLDVNEGNHTLALRVQWCGSQPMQVNVTSRSNHAFNIALSATGIRKALAIWYVTLGRHSFLRLVPMSEQRS